MFAAIAQTPAAQSLLRRVESGGALSCDGVSAAAQPFLAALLRWKFPMCPIVLVCDGVKTQERVQQDVTTWMQVGAKDSAPSQPSPFNSQPRFYPSWEVLPHESKLPHADVISERLETLIALSADHASRITHRAPLIVTCVAALLQKTFPPAEIAARTRPLKRGASIVPLDLIEWLEEQGYDPESKVTQKGELSLRGGILDLWPPTCPWPVRLEFFGDELESLRYFDPHTQISREEISTVTIPPAGELGILKRAQGAADRGPSRPAAATQPHDVGNFQAASDTGHAASRDGSRSAPPLATLLDHLPRETIFLLCNPGSLDLHAANYAQQIPPGDPFFIAWPEFCARLESGGFTFIELNEAEEFAAASDRRDELRESLAESDAEEDGDLHSSSLPGVGLRLSLNSLDAFRPLGDRPAEPQIADAQRREFFAQLHRWLRQGWVIHVFCNNEGERQRFGEIWAEYGFANVGADVGRLTSNAERRTQNAEKKLEPPHVGTYQPFTHLGALARGFLSDEAKLVVVTDAEIFGRYKVQRPRRLKSPHAASTRSALDIDFTELAEGDYVVHVQHGIGRYRGLKFLPANNRDAESGIQNPESRIEHLAIEFAPSEPTQPGPLLYVPVTEAHLVGKYVGAGKARPPLNTLGGTRWLKTKEQTERAVRDVAAELLRVQALRETQPGFAYPDDTPWQREFEGSFLYEETPDQWKAIRETKADLERARPMDRLICGDVGFGKTEVAIRAAFKAVMSGKQVAILVPTTVLAQQHYNTFRERMADYPVRIEMLSRYRTRREQLKIIADLAAGAVDIVIGTHRLVQSDVSFKELGLVVIDEEQRFGVLHKEKFKLLRTHVDVLTLSATPIPRTLHLALTGARDMSTIETPPQDRLPVETFVSPYDERLIRDAIQRELNRDGQVFYLHNRVFDIEAVATKLKTLVPHARLVVGHGQMDADELEDVMTKFVNGEADVLLSTTIIESGLDIPNANTIIIDRADRFGLSDLYQLRGRVGRYKHQAYAYLLIPRHAGLLSDARKRITAIKQYSTLGSGFKIAMRDLEIRGAGNLLGSQQSGHITAVGFELYCQLLKQSVSALKGEKVKPRIEVVMRLEFLAMNAAEEGGSEESSKLKAQSSKVSDLNISVPRETATYWSHDDEDQGAKSEKSHSVPRVPAYVPLSYVPEAQQRIEIYRKLAHADEKASLDALAKEFRDRFGPLPAAVELLLQTAELRLLAAERGVTVIETKDDKLMLTRRGDFVQVGGKFPRLTKKDAPGRMKEIKRLLLAL
ncbi:MAG: transcription-repair coupling factor [Verrucomicrobia bacterium]|nr:transcription-repair coupling factor [Verrucomicrobiota bacterium]